MDKLTTIPKSDSSLVRHSGGMDIESVFKLAIERGGGVDTLERLMAVRREIQAENAKAAYDLSLAAFQSECPIITKHKAGAKGAYKYAPLADIVAEVRGLLLKHGFSYTITGDFEVGWVKAICKVTHSQGHSTESVFKAPIDNKNPMMNDPQRYGGAMTFAKRYAFTNAFGILTADEDVDGAGRGQFKPRFAEQDDDLGSGLPADGKTETEKQTSAKSAAVADLKKELWKLTEKIHGGNKISFRQHLVDDCGLSPDKPVEDLTAEELQKLIATVKGKSK